MCRSISSPPKTRYRLLYVGADVSLTEFVRKALKGDGWFVVRSLAGSVADLLLRSEIRYDLLMFDEVLEGGSVREMVRLVRSLEQRKRTPVILLSQKEGRAQAGRVGERVIRQKAEPYEAVVEAIRASVRLEGR